MKEADEQTSQTLAFPKHVAVIMDGNGRWAKQRHLPRAIGHRAGAKAVHTVIEFAAHKNIEVLTLFALSVENKLFRPPAEVELLLSLFIESLEKNTDELHKNNIKIVIIGDHTELGDALQKRIADAQSITAHNTGMKLVLAINYSGRWDIVQATQKLLSKAQAHSITAAMVDETFFANELSLAGFPEPDLLIRTSGEQRISNFLLWNLAYTELYFTETYWPDFDNTEFQKALDFYQQRNRRFGMTAQQLEAQHG